MKYLRGVVSLQYDSRKCVGCQRCTEVCPHEVFIIENRKAVVQDKDNCMECGACAKNCDYGAIRVNAGVGCAQALINSMLKGGEPNCGCSGDSCC